MESGVGGTSPSLLFFAYFCHWSLICNVAELKLTVICILRAEIRGHNSSKYDAVRYMRNRG